MKVGIDSYCFHRLFGEVYEGQQEPQKKLGYEDFLRYAAKLKVDGVSMETCFFESTEETYLRGLKAIIDEAGFETVVAWGHPDGLEGGKNPEQLEDLKKYFQVCETLGANVMRVVGSSLAFRNEPHGPQIKALVDLFREPAKMAGDRGIKLAMENHFDFEMDEIGEIVEAVGSDAFGITFDTGNALRIGDNPKDFAEKLGKYIFATHTKDVMPIYGGNPKDWYFFACVPVGKGCINMPEVVTTLEKQNYDGLFAIEIDYPHPDFTDEYAAVKESVKYLKKLT
jgi:3-oxoisoapionate decarboxylase